MEIMINDGGVKVKLSEKEGIGYILMNTMEGLKPVTMWTRDWRGEWSEFQVGDVPKDREKEFKSRRAEVLRFIK